MFFCYLSDSNIVYLLAFSAGASPLHRSSNYGHVQACQFLVESKADLHATDV